MEHRFTLSLPEDVARKMNKRAYRASMRYLRTVRRETEKRIDWDKMSQATTDLMLFGQTNLNPEDFLKQ